MSYLNLIKELKESEKKLTESSLSFTNTIALDFTVNDTNQEFDYEAPNKIDITFKVEEEWRSWGLKELIAKVEQIEIPITIIKFGLDGKKDIEEEKIIKIDSFNYDFKNIPTRFTSLEISCNKDLEVISSVIEEQDKNIF